MKKAEKKQINEAPAIAYYSGFGGIEVKKIEYNINDYIIYTSGAWYGPRKAHRVRVYYNTRGAFFRFNGYKIPLDECSRTEKECEL